MKHLKPGLFYFLMLISGIGLFFSCKKTFDEPELPKDPDLKATHTIAQLKAIHVEPGVLDSIQEDMIVSGVVIANDKSGNLYKQIYIQDETGAIQLMLDASGLYNSFPVGRKVFVKCKGMCLSDYGGMIQLGVKAFTNGTTPSIQAIASNLINQKVIGGSLNNPVDITEVNDVRDLVDNDMQDPLLGNLIQLKDFQFEDTTRTYSDTSAYKETINLSIKNCANAKINIRTSGYSNFAGVRVPSGNGNLIAVYTVYMPTRSDKKQLILRDTSDVQFKGFRCGAGPTTIMDIAELRGVFSGAPVTAPAGKSITGVVISDRSTSNINAQNLVLQQGNEKAGIVVRFAAAHNFDLGDSIRVNVSGVSLSEFNSTLQVSNIPLENGILIAKGKSITPRVTTIQDINSNFETWESTLVKIADLQLSGGNAGKYSGSVTLTGTGGTLVMFTATAATFSSQTYPASVKSLTGYLSQFKTTKQIGIRNPATDVVQ